MIEINGEIIKETPKAYLIEKDNGEQVYVCKICGEELKSVQSIAVHYREKHKNNNIKKENNEENDYNYEDEIEEHNDNENKGDNIPVKSIKTLKPPLSPEEEMLEDMVNTLKEQLNATPGIKDESKVNWFSEMLFRKTKRLQEDDRSLFLAIRKHFPKTDEEAINLIVDEVFRIKKQYDTTIRMGRIPLSDDNNRNNDISFFFNGQRNNDNKIIQPPQPQQPQLPLQPQLPINNRNNSSDPMQMMMIQMFQMMMKKMFEEPQQQIVQQPQQSQISPQEIEQMVEARVEKELLKQQMDLLQEQIKEQNEIIKEIIKEKPKSPSSYSSPEGWTDDYARLINELGQKTLELTNQILIENKKTRQMVIKYILPSVIDNRQKLKASGKTDDKIINDLEEMGLVEEE